MNNVQLNTTSTKGHVLNRIWVVCVPCIDRGFLCLASHEDLSQLATKSSQCSDKTLEELQCEFKSRTEQLHHQSVSLAACDVIAASEGNSLSLLLRHIRKTDSMAECCLGWLREKGTEDGCQGNTNEEAD